MERTGVKCLWGTQKLFGDPMYADGAGTSPSPDVWAYALAQAYNAIDMSNALKASGHVFWGGREGYTSILNTNLKVEKDNLSIFLMNCVEYAQKIGFKGQFLIEPKPQEPTMHQYDFDAESVIAFLHQYNLLPYFKLNLEQNHAVLARHSFEHEITVATANNLLGSLDVNQGDNAGWDTDNFPSSMEIAAKAMIPVILAGGIAPGGCNFDAKLRRQSTGKADLAKAFILGMDTYAAGYKIATEAINKMADMRDNRYYAWNDTDVLALDAERLINRVLNWDNEPKLESGEQESYEAIFNQVFITAVKKFR